MFFKIFLSYRGFFVDFSRGVFVFSPAGESAFLTLFFSTAIIEISFVYTEDTRAGEKKDFVAFPRGNQR